MLIEKPQIDNFLPVLDEVKTELGIKLSSKQEDAVKEVFRNNLSVITGSPGTGKTTVLKVILEVYAKLHPENKVSLLAPTGRASRKMAESTGYRNAKTMHNAMGLFGEDGDEEKTNEVKVLDADLIIVDECSMIDMWLASKFFPRIKKGAKVVLVGDPDQLPPVGAGKMFREIIDCGIVPVTILDQIFRQAVGSFIAHNARIINMGETKLYYGDDFVFIPAKNQEDAAAIVMELYCQEIQQNSMEEIQILSPLRSRGEASVDCINQELREFINPFRSMEDEIKIGNKVYRVGDRVMQNKNTKQASNGDLGYIRSIDSAKGITVEVDFGEGRRFQYNAEELGNLELAYATTVHKAQGGEFIGLEGYKLWLTQMEQNGSWINNAMIRGLADAGELELAEHYRQYHDQQAKAREERALARQKELEQESRQRELERQTELEKHVSDAERCILERKELMNISYEGSTIILHLMKKHGIIPPLRTQGWINKKLLKVIIRDYSLSLTYAKIQKCKASRTIGDYLVLLRDKIDRAYSGVQSE